MRKPDLKGCLLVLLLAVLGTAIASENDDLVFDQDGKQSLDQTPLIESQQPDSLLHRIKRGFFDFFRPVETTTTTTTTITEAPPAAEDAVGNEVLDNVPVEVVDDQKPKTSANLVREIRESGEEIAEAEEQDNEIGNTAEARREPTKIGNTDDEDLAGSGDIEGSATSEVTPHGGPYAGNDPKRRYYRITLTIGEPYLREYADRNRREYKELSSNLTQAFEKLFNRHLPGESHYANVVKISPTTADSFTSLVTLDIGSTFTDEAEVRSIIEEQLRLHSLDNIQLFPDEFSLRIFQAGNDVLEEECEPSTELTCRDGACVPLSARCDGLAQCNDASDELDCPATTNRCSAGEFACDVSRCILESERCNFIEDCRDGSDEHDCNYPACSSSQFKCRNGQCIDLEKHCNGVRDCHDDSDERNCPCSDDQFECTPGFCVAASRRCDGITDCNDGTDEADCSNTTYCRPEEFQCGTGICISLSMRCDGRSDCPDRSDEYNCTVTTCSGDQFRCSDGICLNINKRCDSVPDCRNGEDEFQCGCGEGEFRCADGRCIGFELQCNGMEDCIDGSDERDCEKVPWKNVYNDKRMFLEKIIGSRGQWQKIKYEDIWRKKPLTHSGEKIWRNRGTTIGPYEHYLRPAKNMRHLLEKPEGHADRTTEMPKRKKKKRMHSRRKNGTAVDSSSLARMEEVATPVYILGDNTWTTAVVEESTAFERRTKKRRKKHPRRKILKNNANVESSSLAHREEELSTPISMIADDAWTTAAVEESTVPDKRKKKKRRRKHRKQKNLKSEANVDYSTLPREEGLPTPVWLVGNDTWTTATLAEEVTETPEALLQYISHAFDSTEFPSKPDGFDSSQFTTFLNETLMGEGSNGVELEEGSGSGRNEVGEEDDQRPTSSTKEYDPDETLNNIAILEESSTWELTEDASFNASTEAETNTEEEAADATRLTRSSKEHADESSETTVPEEFTEAGPGRSTFEADTNSREDIRGYKAKKSGALARYFHKYLDGIVKSSTTRTVAKDIVSASNDTKGNGTFDPKCKLFNEILQNSSDVSAEVLKDWYHNCSSNCEKYLKWILKAVRSKHWPKIDENSRSAEDIDSGLIESGESTIFSGKNRTVNHEESEEEGDVWGASSNFVTTTESRDLVEIFTETSTSKPTSKEKRKGKKRKNQKGEEKGKRRRKEKGRAKNHSSTTTVDYFVTWSQQPDWISTVSPGDYSKETTYPEEHATTEPTVLQTTSSTTRCRKKSGWWWNDVTDPEQDCEEDNSTETSTQDVEATSAEMSTAGWMHLITKPEAASIGSEGLVLAGGSSSGAGDRCDDDKFLCDLDLCIFNSMKCDKKVDCKDGTDEIDCDYDDLNHENRSRGDLPSCGEHETPCDGACINNVHVCDGFMHCWDGADEADCGDGELAPCPSMDFTCSDGSCITKGAVCDGFDDCPRAEDELHCARECTPTQFKCLTGNKCIEGVYRCDGRPDCPDHSDEDCANNNITHITELTKAPWPDWTTQRPRECDPSREMRCDDGKCVLLRRKCDNIFDCLDGSDERGCGVCTPAEWKCASGECLPENERCDGIMQCSDGSDEDRCVNECPAGMFRCNDGLCLDSKRRCDGRPHCRDGSDEINCRILDSRPDPASSECRNGERQCDNGVCINKDFFCDNNRDCLDGSDERDCPDTGASAKDPVEARCQSDEFTCRDGSCIPHYAVCDNRMDCPDAEDESNCPQGRNADRTSSGGHPDSLTYEYQAGKGQKQDYQPPANLSTRRSCAPDDFVCADGTCIPENQHCDHFYDCRDFTDEQYCFGCGKDQFQCANGDCIKSEQKCDNFINCVDGSDEENCGRPGSDPMPGRCSAGFIMCVTDKDCVPQSSICNGIPECRDRSDEENCEPPREPMHLNLKTYPSEQVIKENPAKQGREVVFQCRDEGPMRAQVRWSRGNNLPLPPGSRDLDGRLEIPNIQLDHAGSYVCEAVGYPQSSPGQQVTVYLRVEKLEQPITNRPHVCQYDQATCSNGECIPKSYVCNGRLDCTDGSDEMRCSPHGCEPNEYRCNNTQCVSKVWRCDGDKDCADGSDEENCAPSRPGSPCRYTEFACASGQCIPKSFHCDMEKDCMDGTDEIGCSPVYIIKPPPPMITLHQGEVLVITCTAIGVPTPEINWRLNWGHIPPKCTMTSVNGTGTLTCPNMQTEDQGAYSCEGLNSAGFVFAVPDAIVMVDRQDHICPKGKFNDDARSVHECISCFCFGVATECRSANLFTYQIPPPLDRHRFVVLAQTLGYPIVDEIGPQSIESRVIGKDGVHAQSPQFMNRVLSGDRFEENVAYFALPGHYHGSQLKSYGGYLKYRVRFNGTGSPNSAPAVVLNGNDYTLIHRGRQAVPYRDNEMSVRFFQGEWLKRDTYTEETASREDIMMTLARVDNILIKAQYDDSQNLDVMITNIVMDTADARNTGLGSASYVEECQCPSGYTGLSCEQCAAGYLRRETGSWLGQCYRDEQPCPPGYYGDPSRNIPCQVCPCPHTNPSNQFARTCHLGSDGEPTCDCPPGYEGRRCEQCAEGYQGNPLIPHDKCVAVRQCDPDGSLSPHADVQTGQCRCKQYATGLTCNQCKANTFSLASRNQFGCISCFCMGITNKCVSSNWYRNDIRVSFTNSVRNFSLIELKSPDAPPIVDGIRLDSVWSREIVYDNFPNRGNNDVYYWQVPNIFLGDQVTSYGGNLKYTVRYVPAPGGQSSRNNAADVELISANGINLLYFSRESPEANTPQTFVVPLLEQYWQRTDGTQADREHLLMALADIRAIRIKATYTTHTDEAGLSLVSLDTAEKHNTGKSRAAEVEECSCPAGYKGLSCENCDVGYTRANEGLYLGICELCNCNGHSTQCDPDTGVCENCAHHTTGESCEYCRAGYEGDATRGTPQDCVFASRNHSTPSPCNCSTAGSRSDFCIGDRCDCKRNVEGPECNRCRPATFGLSADNPDGCSECYCSGVTDQCHESSLYVQQIPVWVYDAQHGFTLTDSTRQEVIDDSFELNIAMNEIGYRYSEGRGRRLFWSLPPVFTGNKIKSYGGNLTLTQHITAYPGAQTYKDQDVILVGNGITLFWTNPAEIQPDIPTTYSVPLRESEWKRLTTAGPRVASRVDLMTVLSHLEAILVRASHSESMTATYISDISLDTAGDIRGGKRAVQVEVCRCPTGYTGTSCESCARGYYRDTNDRTNSYLGSCNLCPCNNHEESCEITRTGQIKCHCVPGYTGQYCQDTGELMVSLTPMTGTVKPYTWIWFTCSYKSSDRLYISFNLSPFRDSPLTATSATPGPLVYTPNGGYRTWYVHVELEPCNVECHIQDREGKDMIKVVTSVSTDQYPPTPTLPPPTIAPPRIMVYIMGPEFQIVGTGTTVEYHCSGTSLDNGSVQVRWEKEGGQLPSGRSVDDNRGLLIIREVKVSDSGIYVCQVSDGVHVAFKNVTLTVGGVNPVAPRAMILHPSLEVIEGEPAEFRCEASGNPPPQIEWTRVYGPMNPEVVTYNGVWSLRTVSRNDAAEYKCTARNNVGVDARTAVLYVREKPQRPPGHGIAPTITPSEWTGAVGEVIRITCTPSQIANVNWTRQGNLPLPVSASQRDGVLTIMNPMSHDSGVYVCTATSYVGTETSSIITITIQHRRPTPSVKVKPEKQTVPQGNVAEVRCLTSGEPGVQVRWSKHMEHMSPNAQQTGDTLRIMNVQISDRGVYVCKVIGPSGSQEASAIIEVEPREAPLLELYPKESQTVILGGSADVQCRAIAGTPMPELHWSRRDNRPFAQNIKQLPGGVLRLTNITIGDSGAYICTASNSVGSTSAVAYIEVHTQPVITISPRSGILTVKRGDRVRLVCTATGNPQPSIEWTKHVNGMVPYYNTPFQTNQATPLSAVYEIGSVSHSDEGSYTCHAMNAAGIMEERVHIRLEDDNEVGPDQNEPTIFSDSNFKIPNGGKVEMRCHVPENSHIYLDWKRSDHRPLPEGSMVHNGVLTVPEVDSSAAGEYVCMGMDQNGNVLFRAKSYLQVTSPPRIVLNPPRQTVGPGENPSIVCSATGDEPMTIEWSAIGRELPYSVTRDRGILQFHGITYSDAGKYVCKATNGEATAEAVAEVLVNERSYEDTRVRAAQRDVIASVGMPVHLRCTVQERATIHWSREGQPLPSNARIEDDYLEIPRARPEDSGRYICQIQTDRGVSSDYINLNVHLHSILDCTRANLTHCGQRKCMCDDQGCVLLDYGCYRYVRYLDDHGKIFDQSNPRNLQQRRAMVPAVSVEVSQDPVNIGDTIDIRCACSGTQNPRYHWSRPNHPSLPANAQEYGSVLRLTNVAVDDSGLYRCTAETPDGIFDQDLNLIVHGGHNDAPAIETKYAPYGSNIEMNCRPNLDSPLEYHWSKLGGLLPRDAQIFESKLNLTNVTAEDAGTYICTVNNNHENIEIPTVLVVTGIVPYFSQAPESFIALPPVRDAYLKFNIEVSFKPESRNGIILYNGESSRGTGDFILLALVRGYPQFSFDLGSGPATIRADKPVTMSEWHTIKLQRNRKEGTMLIDGEGPYRGVAVGRKQGLDLKELLYVGGVPNYVVMTEHASVTTGFVGCISRLVIGEKDVDLNGNQEDSFGITNCETCAENPCNNGGVCQEAGTKNGYACMCRAGYSGKHCDYVGQSCYPGACGEGKCVDNETGFDCYCPHGRTGSRCEHSKKIYDPAFNDEKSFIAHDAPKAYRRFKAVMNVNAIDDGDGILLYCAQSDEGNDDFVAVVVKDKRVEFRYDLGTGTAIIRSNFVLQPGVWTHVSVNREYKEGNLAVNGESLVEDRSPGSARTMTLNTPLYIGGVDRRRIVINRNAGVNKTFRGCISDLGVSSMNVDILKSAIDSANIDDCNGLHPNQTRFVAPTTTALPTTTPYDPCASNPCVHGVCQSADISEYSCTCEYGYVGRNCENILKQCELLLPCSNGGTCTDLHGSYKCDCRLGYSGQNCEKQVEVTYDVAFRGDGWLELDRSVMTHDEEREVLGFEISTNRTKGLVMWHGQTPTDSNPDHYMALAVIDGYVEYQYDLGTGPVVIRVTAQRVDDGERHRIILKRQGSDGSIELNGEHMESGATFGTLQHLNAQGNVYLGGVPDFAMTYGKYQDGFCGCIYTMEVQDSGAIDIGEKAVRGKNVSPCTRTRWIPSSLVFTDADTDMFDAFVPPPPVNIIHPKPAANLAAYNIKHYSLLILLQNLLAFTMDVREQSVLFTVLCIDTVNAVKCILS